LRCVLLKETVLHGTSPGKLVVLYDGHCRFCEAQMKNLLALARPGAVEALSFQEPGVLARFPGLTYDVCMQAMQLISPDGRVVHGFEAAVRAVATRRLLRPVAYLYYVPGIRQLCDLLYRWVAAHRYRIWGKTRAAEECAGGTCSLHAPPR
jgi:predicted DCC family thiol-disulfide oxidoreductase YuxK